MKRFGTQLPNKKLTALTLAGLASVMASSGAAQAQQDINVPPAFRRTSRPSRGNPCR